MIGYPLDSHVDYKPDGTPIYDRAISSAPLRKLINKIISDGVLPNPSTNLQVQAGSGMSILINPGFANVEGCLKLEESLRTLVLQASHQTYDRIDTVVVRLNANDDVRECEFYVIAGTPASSPVRPELARSESIYELGLADILVPANSSVVSNDRITDTRYETARCGIISAIMEFDTTTLYDQIQSDLANFKDVEQADFMAWLANLKNALDGNVAGNLQNQIEAVVARVNGHDGAITNVESNVASLDGRVGALSGLNTSVKTSIVNAINDVNSKKMNLADGSGASAYSSSTSYVAGAVVTYSNKVWRCKTACKGQTPAENTYWTQISMKSLSDETSALNTNLMNIRIYVGADGKLHFVDWNGADSVLPFNSGFDVIFAGQYSFIATKDMAGASGFYTVRAYSYGIYTLSWSDNGGWSIIPSKRIKGKRASWATSGALVFTDFDYMPNVAQNVYQSILLVTDIID